MRRAALPLEMETRLASAWARLAKEKLGKGPGGISMELCGGVLMVTMHQTLTPLERTLAEASGSWEGVRELRNVAMRSVGEDFVQALEEAGLRAAPVFNEIDVVADRQILAFRIQNPPEVLLDKPGQMRPDLEAGPQQ